jgi:integrase/recombinase XerD
MENAVIVQKFKVQLERLGYSKTSILMLPKCVQEFLEVLEIKALTDITPEQIQKHHEYLQTRPNKRRPGGLSESHINHHVYALKTFFKWLEANGEIQINPISGLEFPSPKSKPREILSQEEIKALYNTCENYRERAVLSIYYGCGLRRTEGIKLDLKDIHFRTGLLYVREGKGAKRRVVPMSKQVKNDLQTYAYKERKAKPNETAFLIGHTGMRINENTVSKTLKALLEKAEIKRETEGSPTPLKSFTSRQITLHSLRHSIATHLLESGMSLEDVREFLGHSHLESTQIYTRISKKQLGKL